jgi:hypothetical protein
MNIQPESSRQGRVDQFNWQDCCAAEYRGGEAGRSAEASLSPVGTTDMPTLATPKLLLGESVVRANGFQLDGRPVVVAQNFLPSLRTQGGFPLQIDPVPDDNKSTNHLAVPCLGPQEVALTTTLLPGLLDYYVERGLLSSREQVISFNGDSKNSQNSGFPHFDPLSLALKSENVLQGGYFVSAFSSEFVREQATRLGLVPVQRSDSYETNDKIGFSQAADEYGFTCCPGIALKSSIDILNAAERFRDSSVWVKYSHAFGGDLLSQVKAPVSVGNILSAISTVADSIRQAAEVNDYQGVTFEDLWPEGSLIPQCGGFLIEQDARHLNPQRPGKVLSTGSNLMLVHKGGKTSIKAYFQQIVGPSGDFWGSSALNVEESFGQELRNELDRQCRAIGRYCDRALGLNGLVGVDFMIIQDHDGRVRPVMIELNGRPPISACSHIVGTEKLRAPFWISRYMWTPRPLEHAQQFEELVTIDGKNFARTAPTVGSVIPMYLASVTHRHENGQQEIVTKKNWGQILVAGQSQGHCMEIFEKLKRKGISFIRPNRDEW